MFDVISLDSFLTSREMSEIVREMSISKGTPAQVYGGEKDGAVNTLVRRAARIDVSPEIVDLVGIRLRSRQPEIEEHFDVSLTEFEEPQFLRYVTGDLFVAHQDGNTPLIHDDTRFRKISVVAFLSEQSEPARPGTYSGGSLVLHGSYPDYERRYPVPNLAGTLAAFRPETTHEVTPVTAGERFTIVSWFR